MNTHDWIHLLAMLSSEKSLAYWHRMKLPLPRSSYQQASRYAAACLEVLVFSYLQNRSPDPGYWTAWEEYRNVESVVSDDLLQQHQEISKENVENVFSELETVAQFGESKAIIGWANNWFKSEPDPAFVVVDNLAWLLNNLTDNENISPPEIHKDDIYTVGCFCRRTERRNTSLREHFAIADHVYKMSLPNEREMMLQDIFFEGTRSSYWWMDSVEYTLQFLNFRERWSDLKNDIGAESLKTMLEWVGANQGKTPYLRTIDHATIDRLLQL